MYVNVCQLHFEVDRIREKSFLENDLHTHSKGVIQADRVGVMKPEP